MKKILILMICLAVIAFAVNVYAGQQLKEYALCPAGLFFEYPEGVADVYKPAPIDVYQDIANRLEVGMSEEEVLERFGLPDSAIFTDWYEMHFHWDEFSWDKWDSGEYWNGLMPIYNDHGTEVMIVYDEQRNIKEFY